MKREFVFRKGETVMHELTREQELINSFIKTDRIHRAVVEQQVKTLGIHRSQHMMLMHLSCAEDAPTQAELARDLGISPAAVTVSLQKLEKAGLVERSYGGDERAKNIRLTDAGLAIVRKTEKMFRKIDTAMCAGFSEEQLETFLAAFKVMQDNLRNLQEE